MAHKKASKIKKILHKLRQSVLTPKVNRQQSVHCPITIQSFLPFVGHMKKLCKTFP